MTALQGERLGYYTKTRRERFIHLGVWLVILVICMLILAPALSSGEGVFGGSGFGTWVGIIAALLFLFAGISFIMNIIGLLLGADNYLSIYEDGFQHERSGLTLTTWLNKTKTHSWDDVTYYMVTTKSLHDALGAAGSPDPLTGVIVKLIIGIFTQTTPDVEYALSLTLIFKDGKRLTYTGYRGDNFEELIHTIMPRLLPDKKKTWVELQRA